MYFIAVAILCLNTVSTTPIHPHDIHKRMTPEEVHQVFGTSHEDVPEYKVVNVHVSRIQKRYAPSKSILGIHSDDGKMDVVLSPTEGFIVSESTPVTFVTYSNTSGGFEFNDVPQAMEKIGDLMEDPDTSSFFVISQDRNRRDVVNGYIGSRNLVVRSLPKRLGGSLFSDEINSHAAFELKPSKRHPIERHIRDTVDPRTPDTEKLGLPSIPKIIYPEILVAIDSTAYPLYGYHLDSLLIYHLILWYSVHMRFRSLRNPDVNLNIARFVISEESTGNPYIEAAYYDKSRILTHTAIMSSRNFWYAARSKLPVPSWDAVVMFTGKELLSLRMTEGDPKLGASRGAAIVGSMCEFDDENETFGAVALIRDRHDLDAYVAAHELGHLLGIRHDSGNEQSPCPTHQSYIMTADHPYSVQPENSFNSWYFSTCSARDLQSDLQNNDRRCLFNKPETRTKILPSVWAHTSLVTADRCSLRFGKDARICESSNYPKEEECRNIYCQLDGDDECFTSHLVPEDGAPCDDGNKYCRKGVCRSI